MDHRLPGRESEWRPVQQPSLKKCALTSPKIRSGPHGVHLFWRDSGLNILCDEVRVPPTVWSNAPRNISVALTNSCDLKCQYCYAPKHRAILPVDPLLSWLSDLDSQGCLGVGFGGGEPTLHPQFSHICHRVMAETQLAITFTTHGHRLDNRTVTALKGAVHFIRISVDGVGAVYEANRGKSFESLCHSFEIASRLAPFGINFVVNATTFGDLDAAIVLASQVGATEFLLLPEQPVNGTGGIDSLTLRLLHGWIANYDGKIPLVTTEINHGDVIPYPTFTLETGLLAYAHIDASGSLKRSSYDRNGIDIGRDVMHALEALKNEEGG